MAKIFHRSIGILPLLTMIQTPVHFSMVSFSRRQTEHQRQRAHDYVRPTVDQRNRSTAKLFRRLDPRVSRKEVRVHDAG